MYEPKSKKVKLPQTGKEVTVREPLVRDQLAVAHIDNHVERGFEMLVNLTGMDRDELLEIPLSDYQALDDAATEFVTEGDGAGF